MIRKDFILSQARNLLSEFLQPIADRTDRPRKKFLRQTVGAILLSGSMVINELCWWIRDDCSDRFYRLKRLLN